MSTTRYARLGLPIACLALMTCSVTSCSSPQQRPPTSEPAADPSPAHAAAGFTPAPHYAPLFEEGRSFTFRGTRAVTMWNDSDPAADEEGNVTQTEELELSCTVAEVRRFDDAIANRLDCGEENRLLVGTYGATSEGLWHIEAIPESAEELVRMQHGRPPLIAAEPQVGQRRTEQGEEEPSVEVREVTRTDRGAWCSTLTNEGIGDDMAETFCFAQGAGIVQYDNLFSGGSVIDVHLELVTPE